jgi:hypothetical protein
VRPPQSVVTCMGKQAESAALLKKVMSALRTGKADHANDIHKRKSLVTALLDGPPTEVETKVLKDEEAPPASASNKKPRSKFRLASAAARWPACLPACMPACLHACASPRMPGRRVPTAA